MYGMGNVEGKYNLFLFSLTASYPLQRCNTLNDTHVNTQGGGYARYETNILCVNIILKSVS